MTVDDIPIFPNLKADASLNASYQKRSLTLDSKTFPPETNKIETVGNMLRKTFVVFCDSKGHMDFKHLADPVHAIKRLSELADDGVISKEDFERKKNELLGRI